MSSPYQISVNGPVYVTLVPENLMSDIATILQQSTDLTAQMTMLTTHASVVDVKLADIATLVADLKAEVAAGGAVTPAQLDALSVALSQAQSSATQVDASLTEAEGREDSALTP